MINIAIVEDNLNDIHKLESHLNKYRMSNNLEMNISIFQDGLSIITDYMAKFDIILMDIQMKHLDGMKAAQKIRAIDSNVIIIFITTTIQYAVQGYTVDALGYILKPVPYLVFYNHIEKAVHHIQVNRKKSTIVFSVENSQVRLDTDQIYHLESQNHTVRIITESGSYCTSGPLKRFEQSLSIHGFHRVHNAFLVNLKHVVSIDNGAFIQLTSGTSVPLSRTYKKSFMEHFTDYLGELQ